MKSTQFYIQELELEHEPNMDDVTLGFVEVEFEVLGQPEYLEDPGHLQSQFAIHFDLLSLDETGSDQTEQTNVGQIDVEFLSVIKGTLDEFEDYLQTWKEEEYRAVDWDLRYHIESGLMTEVISPVASLIDNSFRGILPQMTLTEPPNQQSIHLGAESGFEIEDLEDIDHGVIAKAVEEAIGEELGDEEIKLTVARSDEPDESEDKHEGQ